MNLIGIFDGKIFENPANRYCIVRIKSADTAIPAAARAARRYPDHLIRFTAVGYELPMTSAVQLELDGEWVSGKYGMQFWVDGWKEVVPKTTDGVLAYLGSGLIKGVGTKTAQEIVARFGADALDILEHQPERLTEVRGITQGKLAAIRQSYAETSRLRDLMALLAPFHLTPKTAASIYQQLGPACVDILRKSPFELCRISGFGFRRVDAIVQKTGYDLHDPMRIMGAARYALEDARGKMGHLFLPRDELLDAALKLLNERIPLPQHRLRREEVETVLQDMILSGQLVLSREMVYLAAAFAQEDETARQIARLMAQEMPREDIVRPLQKAKADAGLTLSEKQEAAVYAAFRYPMSIITGSPGTGKTTVLRMILEVYRALHPDGKILHMAPTGRASRRMAESTGFGGAKTMHSGLGLINEENEQKWAAKNEPLDAGLVVIDEISMVDMWLAKQFFPRIAPGTRLVLVGDPDQLPSVGAGNVFRELIGCGLVPVTVLDRLFRQAGDSLIAYNAKFINEGNTRLFFGKDFVFLEANNQEEAARILAEQYCKEIEENGIAQVQILSPFRTEGQASANQLNAVIREIVNPFRSDEEEIPFGSKSFRVGDRIMQTRNTKFASNGDLGFIRAVKDTDEGKRITVEFGEDRRPDYRMDDLVDLDFAYATTVHKSIGTETAVILMPLLKAHAIMLYRNLLYTGITRARKKVVLVGQRAMLYMAIHRSSTSQRNTMLGERIRLYHKAFAKSPAIVSAQAPPQNLKAAG